MAVKSAVRQILEAMLQRRVNAGGLRVGGKKRVHRGGIPVGGRKKAPKRKAPKRKGGIPPALKSWHAHLKKVRHANPHLTMAAAMKKASGSY